MSGASAPVASDGKPQRQPFRRQNRALALSPDQKRRQAAITSAAWRFFGAGEAMIAFLNADNAALGGRPLDMAVDSDDGLAAVLAQLRPVVEAAA